MKIIERDIYLTGEINSNNCAGVISKINSINQIDEENRIYLESQGSIYNPKPIKIWIDSPGGIVYPGLGLYDIIKASKTPVHTYLTGMAFSMGGHIFLAGHKRFTSKSSTFMIHTLSGVSVGKIGEIEESIEEMDRLQEVLDGTITSNTIINQDKLNSIRRRKLDWYLNAQDMIKYKIAHEIL